MKNRFLAAVLIQDPGACNPAGVARALVEAIDDARQDEVHEADDPACRLICHQLAFLLRVDAINHNQDLYEQLMDDCRDRATPRS